MQQENEKPQPIGYRAFVARSGRYVKQRHIEHSNFVAHAPAREWVEEARRCCPSSIDFACCVVPIFANSQGV